MYVIIRYLSINLSMAVWFCWSHLVTSSQVNTLSWSGKATHFLLMSKKTPDRVSEDRERKPTRSAHGCKIWTKKYSYKRDSSSLFQVFWIDSFIKILLCCWFHYFLVLSWFSEPFWKLLRERCLCPAPWHFLNSKLRQTALKLTPKCLNYTQIGTLP